MSSLISCYFSSLFCFPNCLSYVYAALFFVFLPQSYAAFFFPMFLKHREETLNFLPHFSSPCVFSNSVLPYVSHLLSSLVILLGFKHYVFRTVARVQRKQTWTGGDEFTCLGGRLQLPTLLKHIKLYGITARSSLRSKLATLTSSSLYQFLRERLLARNLTERMWQWDYQTWTISMTKKSNHWFALIFSALFTESPKQLWHYIYIILHR